MTKKLLDSNIIIYASQPGNEFLREDISNDLCFISIVSKIEVLGYHKLKEQEYQKLVRLFEIAPLISLSDNIISGAIEVRKGHNLSLGDSIIAATALENELLLSTRNTKDFEKVEGLQLVNPFND